MFFGCFLDSCVLVVRLKLRLSIVLAHPTVFPGCVMVCFARRIPGKKGEVAPRIASSGVEAFLSERHSSLNVAIA